MHTFYIIVLLIASVLAGVLLGKFFGDKEKFAKNLLILSAGFLITICVNEVFPAVYQSGDSHIGLWVIAGVIMQMLLESLTKGFEHGHFHHHSDSQILPVALILGMFVHAFIEGFPLAYETEVFSPYLQGIIFHNLPISFILGAFLFKNKNFSGYSWLVITLFALASPLGVVAGHYFDVSLQPYFMAVVGGIFLHISSVIIFESNRNHNVNWSKIAWVILGVALAFFIHSFHAH